MALQTCWRCLSRSPLRPLPSQHLLPYPHFLAAFTTSASLQVRANTQRKNAPEGAKRGETQGYNRKKQKRPKEKIKKPEVGERKALRKRIVLSNTNALEVQGIQNITQESIGNEDFQGQIVGLPGPIVDRLRAVEAFKVGQGWSLFRRPCMLIRPETIEYGKLIEQMNEKDGTRKTIRRVLVGERGNGKSVMLLQTMAMAFLKDWIVINLPDGIDTIMIHFSRASELTEIFSNSPRDCNWPYRIRSYPWYLSVNLQPKSLHFLPSRRHL